MPKTLALPFARLREEVLPRDHAVVSRIETDARYLVAHVRARVEQSARVRDAGEQCEVRLRDAERLVGPLGFTPRGDLFTAHPDDAGNDAARMHRAAQSVERRRVIVVDAPTRKVSARVARPRNLVRLRKGDCLVEPLHDIHDSHVTSRSRRTSAILTRDHATVASLQVIRTRTRNVRDAIYPSRLIPYHHLAPRRTR